MHTHNIIYINIHINNNIKLYSILYYTHAVSQDLIPCKLLFFSRRVYMTIYGR